jgi:hypothetical protein
MPVPGAAVAFVSVTAAEEAGAPGPPAAGEPVGAVPVVCAEAIPTASKAVHDNK